MLEGLINTGEAVQAQGGQVVRVPLGRVLDNPWQHRRHYDEGTLRELAGSLLALREQLPETSGLQQAPLARVVRRDEAGAIHGVGAAPFDAGDPELFVQLLFGHRRLRAFALLAGDGETPRAVDYATFPVALVEAGDAELWRHALTENALRDDVSAIEEAELLQRAMGEFGLTAAQVGVLFGWSRSTVANKLRLLELPEPYRRAMVEGVMSETHGRALLVLAKAPHLLELADFGPERVGAMPRRELEATIKRAVARLHALSPAPGTSYMSYSSSWSEHPGSQHYSPQAWPYEWAPEPAVEGILGACTGCRWRVTFAGDGGPRCAQPSRAPGVSSCVYLKGQVWREQEAARQAAALQEVAAESEGVSRETGKPLPAGVVEKTTDIHLFEQGSYYAPAKLVEKGLCSAERCECWRLVYAESAGERHVRPDAAHAPNICVGCASEGRLRHRIREMEEGPGYMAARKAKGEESREQEARVRDALKMFTAEALWNSEAFLRAVVGAGTLSEAFNYKAWDLAEMQERIWMHAAKHRCATWDGGTKQLWKTELVDAYLAELGAEEAGAEGDGAAGWTGLQVTDKLVEVLRKATMEPADQALCLGDLLNGREGWYHDMLLCYVPAEVLAALGPGAARQAAEALGLRVRGLEVTAK